MFLWLSSPEQAIKRVKQRVVQGGHNIPEEVIRRRYHTGLKNLLKSYLPLADVALILDNSLGELLKIIASKSKGYSLEIEDVPSWEKLQRIACGEVR